MLEIGAMKFRSLLIAAGALIALASGMFYKRGLELDESYDQKMFVAYALQSSGDLRKKIETEILRSGDVEMKSDLPSGGREKFRIDFSRVTRDGSILAFSRSAKVVVLIEPKMHAGKVTWYCSGYPREAIPASCGQ